VQLWKWPAVQYLSEHRHQGIPQESWRSADAACRPRRNERHQRLYQRQPERNPHGIPSLDESVLTCASAREPPRSVPKRDGRVPLTEGGEKAAECAAVTVSCAVHTDGTVLRCAQHAARDRTRACGRGMAMRKRCGRRREVGGKRTPRAPNCARRWRGCGDGSCCWLIGGLWMLPLAALLGRLGLHLLVRGEPMAPHTLRAARFGPEECNVAESGPIRRERSVDRPCD